MTAAPVNRLSLAVVVIGSFGLLGIAIAAAQTSPQGDPNRGAVVAAQGVPKAGVPACAQCHAYTGSSDGSGAFPRLAGQPAYYLGKELADYASGVRSNAIMTPIAKGLDPSERADVAAYYAEVNGPFLPLAEVSSALFKCGEQLAKIGDETKGLQSCDNCHGPGGAGQPPAIPYLAGQYGPYIAMQLRMWQRGYRRNSDDAMAYIAKRLSDGDIDAVAAYFQQVRRADQLAQDSRK